VLQTKTNEIIDSFEMAGIKVLNLITDGTGARPQAPAAAAARPAEPASRAANPAGSVA